MPAYRYIVQGRVQGVGYRYFARRQAEALGIAGYARNRPDGSVEVVAEGTEEALGDFEGRLRAGPDFATVTGLERAAIAERGDHGFSVR
jgi:acylphosphatase